MRKHRTLFILTLAAVTLSGAFVVRPGESSSSLERQKVFNGLDANRDGRLTEKEFVITGLHEIFKSFDLNGSGKVSKKEFMKATAEHDIDHAAEWASMSGGGNNITFKQSLQNTVAIEEMKSHFRKLDKAGRGYVTMEDLD